MTHRTPVAVFLLAALVAVTVSGCGSNRGHRTQHTVTLTIAHQGKLGSYLVSGGRTLYMYPPDRQRAVTCTSVGDCVSAWPPLFTKTGQQVKAGRGVDRTLVGTMRGDHGTVVTYNHWPLYYYIGDTKPGQVHGQDQGFNWFVIAPNGRPIRTGPINAD